MITIANYGVGNLASIKNILQKIGERAVITDDPVVLSQAERIILPGVGSFDACATRLNESGLREVLDSKVLQEGVPVLGICVGMQLLLGYSEEGQLQGLNWIPGKVVRFREHQLPSGFKVPHMGWAEVNPEKDTFLLKDMHEHPRFYFVHSYHAEPEDKDHELMTANYGYEFTAAVRKDNIMGVQFHPEKSHRFGMQLLKNFATQY